MRQLLLAVFLLTACAAPVPTATPAPSATPTRRPCAAIDLTIECTATPAPPLNLPGPGHELVPGNYTSADPAVSFHVDEGWTTVQQFPGFFDIQDDPGSLDVVAVQFTSATGFDTAEDAAADIEGRDSLVVSARKQVTTRSFGGDLAGIRLTVDTSDPVDSDPVIFRPVFTAPPGPISIGSGRRLQIDLFTTSEGVLAILVGGSIAKWDRAKQLSHPVLETVVVSAVILDNRLCCRDEPTRHLSA